MAKFSKRGHDVTAVTPLYCLTSTEKANLRQLNVKLSSFNPFYISKKVRLRSLRYLLFGLLFVGRLFGLLYSLHFDVVVMRNCVVGFSASLLRRFFKVPFVISLTDLLSGFLYEEKVIPPFFPNFVVNLMVFLESRIPRAFDKIFVITPRMGKVLEGAGAERRRIVVTYDGVDINLFSPNAAARREIRLRYGLGDRLVAIFQGTLEFHHGLGNMAETIRYSVAKRSGVHFLIVGDGPGREYLQNALQNYIQKGHVTMTGAVQHEDMPRYIAASDVGVIPYAKSYCTDIIVTLKLLEYLAMEKPVVSMDLSGIRSVFGSFSFLRLSKNVRELAENIERFANMSENERATLGREARQVIEKRFSWDVITERMVDECLKLATARKCVV